MRGNGRGLLILLAILVLIVVLVPVFWGGMMGPGMMRGYVAPGGSAGGWSWAWSVAMGLGMLGMLAFWGAVIVGAILLVRWVGSATTGPGRGTGESALDILKRRYAAGEITREEYEQMRQALEA